LIFHLAGVNRPVHEDEFITGNVHFTQLICKELSRLGRRIPLVLSSSSQAERVNAYGRSKRMAEEEVARYAESSDVPVWIYRLQNVFGKWCRPHYNSVVATFCHNIARGEPSYISDRTNEVNLVYIDDVIHSFLRVIDQTGRSGIELCSIEPSYTVSLGYLETMLLSFKSMRETHFIPKMDDSFVKKLYATYLAYLPPDGLGYQLDIKTDNRGSLAEFVKSKTFGQMFVSRTLPGVVRGNHYHHTKVEKFLVLEGSAIIRFRHVTTNHLLEYRINGREYRVVDIPPGYTHSIENIGDGELITLFWASEPFDINLPDTIMDAVLK
jgi:UDP-2-acetamido-2,6-beta-L-arabino-hexul-4-ose reductase